MDDVFVYPHIEPKTKNYDLEKDLSKNDPNK